VGQAKKKGGGLFVDSGFVELAILCVGDLWQTGYEAKGILISPMYI